MKVSSCCGMGPENKEGICPNPKCSIERCEWVEDENQKEDYLANMRREGREHATMLAVHLDGMMAAKATIPVTVKDANYVITVERVPDTTCPHCGQKDIGQKGEHSCPKCGLPLTWDNEPDGVTGEPWGKRTEDLLAPVSSDPLPDRKCTVDCVRCKRIININDMETPDYCKPCVLAMESENDHHASDCATHNMPDHANGPCDCGTPPKTVLECLLDAVHFTPMHRHSKPDGDFYDSPDLVTLEKKFSAIMLSHDSASVSPVTDNPTEDEFCEECERKCGGTK